MTQRSLIIVLLVAGISFGISAQRIIAGMHGSNDYYYDFIPDKILSLSTSTYDHVTHSLDINNDGINDLIFGAQREVNHWNGYIGLYLSSLNQTGFTIEGFDSCFAIFDSTLQYQLFYLEAMAKSFSKYDTIRNNLFWYPSKVYMKYGRGSVNQPWIQGYSCGGIMDTNKTDYYVGVKVLIPNDTLYGWIKIRIGDFSITIEEYACNLHSIGMDEPLNEFDISIYPNPTNGQLFIRNTRFNKSKCTIQVFNVLGECIFKAYLNSEETTIDISEKPKGIYMIKVFSDNACFAKKVIVQ